MRQIEASLLELARRVSRRIHGTEHPVALRMLAELITRGTGAEAERAKLGNLLPAVGGEWDLACGGLRQCVEDLWRLKAAPAERVIAAAAELVDDLADLGVWVDEPREVEE